MLLPAPLLVQIFPASSCRHLRLVDPRAPHPPPENGEGKIHQEHCVLFFHNTHRHLCVTARHIVTGMRFLGSLYDTSSLHLFFFSLAHPPNRAENAPTHRSIFSCISYPALQADFFSPLPLPSHALCRVGVLLSLGVNRQPGPQGLHPRQPHVGSPYRIGSVFCSPGV